MSHAGQPSDQDSVSTSGTEDFADLFGVEPSGPPEGPQERLIEYRRPSSGEVLSVRMVAHHVLWGNHLWNGARWMSDYIEGHRDEFAGKRILELGAGAGLPSILAAKAGARMVVCTDYPDRELVANIECNIQSLLTAEEQTRCRAAGYLWGASPEELLALNDGQPFDMIIMCDVIFNHSEHRRLLQSATACMAAAGGVIWCVFSHYRPWYMDRDLALFTLATDEFSLADRLVERHQYDSIASALRDDRADSDVPRTVYAHQLYRVAE